MFLGFRTFSENSAKLVPRSIAKYDTIILLSGIELRGIGGTKGSHEISVG